MYATSDKQFGTIAKISMCHWGKEQSAMAIDMYESSITYYWHLPFVHM